MDNEFCPVHEAIQFLQEKWVLHIVRSLLEGPRGFNELSRSVGGCNPATLAQRLDRLVEIGVVDKEVQSVMPPRTLYRLTAAGQSLQQVLNAIDSWATQYLRPAADRGAVCDQQHATSDSL
ncbi:MAG: helix-turn-helix domain-containing protein [Thermaerobacter sp.]|nr:helix-turn-helix domain-containing protein [Thermaerobacter sp.]